ncbi:MAG: BamA/TamA family outer membrane protein [Armatimonadota bacterium]|nr:BamA/TamA family outer membrane protein [Armatimonadota bacterium]
MQPRVHLRLRVTLGAAIAVVALLGPLTVLGGAQPTPAPSPPPAPSPSPAPAPAPGQTPAPSPSPAVSPSPGPTPTPAPPPTIVEVAVRGLEHVPESVVRDSIGVRAGELLSDERLRADVAAIISTGWFADATVRVEPLRDGVRVNFLVVENPVIADIAVEGNTVIRTPEILQALNLPIGQVLNTLRLRDGARAVEKLYEERGYVLARVADVGVTGNGVTRLRLRIAEGRIEAIEYKGLTKTQPFVLERRRPFAVGDVLNINVLNRYLQEIFALELFENVQARPRPGSTPEQVVVEIEVKEQRTQEARFGLGYSDMTGIVGTLEYRERNWKGRNQQLTVRFERGLGERGLPRPNEPAPANFLFSFREPHLDVHRTSLDVALYQATTTEARYVAGTTASRFTLERLGSAMAFARPLDPQTTLSLRLRSERTEITVLPRNPGDPPCTGPSDPNCPPPPNFTPGRTLGLTLTGVRDRRDPKTSPTRGDRLSLTTDVGLPILGGEFGFGKYLGEYTRYLPAGSGVLVGRGLLGFGHGTLPIQEEFTLGGSSTLRAFPFGYLRGSSAVLLNVEYRVPLGGLARQLRDFTGIAFIDAGAAPILTNATVGYGVGLSFNTPIGAIRIDYATGSGGSQTWFAIGHPF